MLTIVIPMAGAGSRFSAAGYSLPKPLIDVHGRPMIEVVVDNLRPVAPHRFVFICQQDHIDRYGLTSKLIAIGGKNSVVVAVDGLTDGAASTVLRARQYFDNDGPLVIANSDQYIDVDINDFLRSCPAMAWSGCIMTMKADDPKWSFVKLDRNGCVTRVVEKEVVSDEATVGIYHFARGRDFALAADSMIADDERVNGEFYVAPAYNRLISRGGVITIFNIGEERNGMYGLGIPADLEHFLTLIFGRVEPGK